MQKTNRNIALMLVLMLLLVLMGCSTPVSNSTVQGDESESANSLKVKFFCKNLGDLSYNDKAWEGVQASAEKYGWIAEVVECGADTATYENAFLDTCESGEYDVIITQAGYGMSDLCIKYAPDYPDMKFIVYDMVFGTDISEIENMFGVSFKQNEGAYLAGALAGKLTTSNQVGVFLMGDVPAVNDYGTGYIAGVRAANEEATVTVAYGGGIADATKLQEISSAMFDRGIDVIFGCSSSCFPGLARETIKRGGFDAGLYTIGVDSDMWVTYEASENPQYADVIITSAMKRTDSAVQYCCDKMMDGTIEWGTIDELGIAEGGTGIADNEYYRSQVPEDVLVYIDELQEQILNGELVPTSYYDFSDYDAFAAWRSEMSSIDENSIS